MRGQVEKLQPPKVRLFVCEEGKDLTDEQLAQVKPSDSIVIQGIPAGYFGGEHDDD